MCRGQLLSYRGRAKSSPLHRTLIQLLLSVGFCLSRSYLLLPTRELSAKPANRMPALSDAGARASPSRVIVPGIHRGERWGPWPKRASTITSSSNQPGSRTRRQWQRLSSRATAAPTTPVTFSTAKTTATTATKRAPGARPLSKEVHSIVHEGPCCLANCLRRTRVLAAGWKPSSPRLLCQETAFRRVGVAALLRRVRQRNATLSN